MRLFALVLPVVAPLATFAVPALADSPSGTSSTDALPEVSLADSGWVEGARDVEPTADGLLVDFADNLSDDDIARIEAETGLTLEDTTKEADGNLWVLHGTSD